VAETVPAVSPERPEKVAQYIERELHGEDQCEHHVTSPQFVRNLGQFFFRQARLYDVDQKIGQNHQSKKSLYDAKVAKPTQVLLEHFHRRFLGI
jgi:hypothetical protein